MRRVTTASTWTLTAIALLLFVALSWVFADGVLVGSPWNSEAWVESPLISWVMMLLILFAGFRQATSLPADGLPLPISKDTSTPGQTDDPVWWHLLTGNVYWALLWLPLRFFVGREWLAAGTHKVTDPAWMSDGTALRGFWERAVSIPEQGRPPITYGWFRNFLQYMLDHGSEVWFAKVVAIGEVLIGLGLIVGALVGIAAFFGTVMNVSFGLAGTASTNPILFGLGVFLVLAWRVAGYWGLDRYLLPLFGVRPNPVPSTQSSTSGSAAAGGAVRS